MNRIIEAPLSPRTREDRCDFIELGRRGVGEPAERRRHGRPDGRRLLDTGACEQP